ncbi:hypothetical protein BHM03_00016903 [Ensete ventricosum]|nr:hypothetical protein BHM03_00016903 [Ensete ventricosum]
MGPCCLRLRSPAPSQRRRSFCYRLWFLAGETTRPFLACRWSPDPAFLHVSTHLRCYCSVRFYDLAPSSAEREHPSGLCAKR